MAKQTRYLGYKINVGNGTDKTYAFYPSGIMIPLAFDSLASAMEEINWIEGKGAETVSMSDKVAELCA